MRDSAASADTPDSLTDLSTTDHLAVAFEEAMISEGVHPDAVHCNGSWYGPGDDIITLVVAKRIAGETRKMQVAFTQNLLEKKPDIVDKEIAMQAREVAENLKAVSTKSIKLGGTKISFTDMDGVTASCCGCGEEISLSELESNPIAGEPFSSKTSDMSMPSFPQHSRKIVENMTDSEEHLLMLYLFGALLKRRCRCYFGEAPAF